MNEILIEGKELTKEFPSGKKKVHAVSGVSLQIHRGETLGLVGESGCGKSTLGRVLIGLIKAEAGELFYQGRRVKDLDKKEKQAFRRHLQLIFQDPYASLDPRMPVRELVAEPLRTYRECRSRREMDERVLGLLRDVGIPEDFLYRYPHQLSGGQRQRIGIARALAASPELIVCDEPVSALDVSVQNQILNLLIQLQKERGLTYLFISHDLSVIRHISDRVAVMFLGKLCEVGPVERVFESPCHPYTRFLLSSIPVPDPRRREEEIALLTGEIPSPTAPPPGCRFHTRCPYATDLCRQREPLLQERDGREVACHQVGMF